jgi:hypothetical protein
VILVRSLLFLLLCPQIFGSDLRAQTVSGEPGPEILDPRVDFVQTGGSWADSTGYGDYRIVVMNESWDQVRSSVFIQWMEYVSADRSTRVRSSTRVEELEHGFWSVSIDRWEMAESRFVATLSGADPHTGDTGRFRVSAGNPGEYSFAVFTPFSARGGHP